MSVEVGQQAPDFELPDQNRQPVKLSDFRGAKNVVLMFYPFTFTPVCSGEICAIRDASSALRTADTEVLSVSVDSVFSHKVYAESEGIDYPLLADFWPHGEVARSYGVFDDAIGAAIRGTFVIDKSGVVRWTVVNAVPDARDISDYQRALAEL
jgi:peroxiredoxin